MVDVCMTSSSSRLRLCNLAVLKPRKRSVSAALEETECPTTRLALLEVLAQAQTGLQEHAAAAPPGRKPTSMPPRRMTKGVCLSRHARLSVINKTSALLHLAQEHLPHIHAPQNMPRASWQRVKRSSICNGIKKPGRSIWSRRSNSSVWPQRHVFTYGITWD
jgi:hypothetical protein